MCVCARMCILLIAYRVELQPAIAVNMKGCQMCGHSASEMKYRAKELSD